MVPVFSRLTRNCGASRYCLARDGGRLRWLSQPVSVVYDVNVLVGAVAGGNSPFRSWPSPPPTSGNPFADCLGIVVDAAEFGLWLSPHILDNTGRVLAEGLKWAAGDIERFVGLLVEIADHSRGGVVDPPATVGDCADWEDNRILISR